MKLEITSIECKCWDMKHRVRFAYDPEDKSWTCDVLTTPDYGFFKRCKEAFQHIFTRRQIREYGCLMRDEELEKFALDIQSRAAQNFIDEQFKVK